METSTAHRAGQCEMEAADRLEFDLARVLERGGECLVVFDSHRRFLYVNRPAATALGSSESYLLGKTLTEALPFFAGTALHERHERAFDLQTPDYFETEVAEAGIWLAVRLLPIENGGLIHFFRDITSPKVIERDRERLLTEQTILVREQQRLREEAENRADRDALTGLYNHRAFHRCLRQAAGNATASEPLALVLLDVNNFKAFNETYGHLVGDTILTQLSDVLQTVQAGDVDCPRSVFAARIGGDEFALLFSTVDRAGIDDVIHRLRARLSDVSYIPPGAVSPVPFEVAAGSALLPGDAVTATEAYLLADERVMRDKVGEQTYGSDALREMLKDSVEGFAMLDALVTAVDNKDRYTRRHSEDVLLYAVMMAEQMTLPEDERASLMVAALVHDVGKIGVPDRVLRTPGRLSASEYELMKQHPAMGAIMVSAVPELRHTLDAVRHHHERWDGGGYPSGLHGEDIPLAARILAVADAFSAMTTDRPYRVSLPKTEALKRLRAGAGTQWDARCVAALHAIRSDG